MFINKESPSATNIETFTQSNSSKVSQQITSDGDW